MHLACILLTQKKHYFFPNLFKEGGIGNCIERGLIFPQIENWRKTKWDKNIFLWSSQGTSLALSSRKNNYSPSTTLLPRENVFGYKRFSTSSKPEIFHSGLQSTEMGFLGPWEDEKACYGKTSEKTHPLSKNGGTLWKIGLKAWTWLWGLFLVSPWHQEDKSQSVDLSDL